MTEHWLPIRDGDLRGLAIYLRHYSSKKGRSGYCGRTAKGLHVLERLAPESLEMAA